MGNQQRNEPRAFRVALIYMVEERTQGKIAELYEQLQACGIEVFLFSKDMPAVESHEAEMHRQITNADSVIICYSDHFEKGKGYRHQEVRIALKEQKLRPPGNAYLLPIRLDDCQIPDYLSEPRMLNYFHRDHFEGIVHWGLSVRRDQLLEEGRNIEAFTYDLPQRTPETGFPGDVPRLTNRTGSPEVWNVPYRRNPHFTGREELLDRLGQQLSPEVRDGLATTRRAALTQPQAIKGLGGIGKTQIALEYAYRSREQRRYSHILWVNAGNEEALLTSFIELAELLPAFSARNEINQHKLVAAIKRWLEQCQQPWLLIFDNTDDVTLVHEYLPGQGLGSILLTTRADAVGALASSFEVETMGFVEGTQLLLRRAQRFASASDEDFNQAGNIVIALDHFPLALDQAAAFIEETQCSFVEYLEIYQQDRDVLLARRGKQIVEYPDSVATTWSLSFQKVQKANPAAVELLQLCAFLAPERIPEELLKNGAAYWPSHLQQAVTDLLTFRQMIEELLKFSLVKPLVEDQALSIHPLVQAIQRDQMERETQRQWAERVVQAVNEVFPNNPKDITTWQLCIRYLAQAQVCNTLIEQFKLSFIEAADLLNLAGLYVHQHALYTIAEPLYQRALSIREQRMEFDDPAIGQSLNNLATLYKAQGKYTEAEDLYERVVHIWEQQLGLEHPDTALSLNNLATLYRDHHKYEQAESLYLRALAIREQQLGAEHPDTAASLSGLASLYRMQGKYEQAEPLLVRALAIYEQQLGTEHPDTAASLSGLASLYHVQGKYEQAEPLLVRALAIYEQQLGGEHPDTAASLSGLASLYRAQGKYEQAEPLLVRALAIYKQQLGGEHPDIAASLNSLASLYLMQGKYEQAEPLLVHALFIHEQHLGTEHPETAASLNNLALLYQAQEKYEQAEPLLVRALAICEQQLGIEHPNTTISLDHLALLYQAQEKYEQAEPLLVRVLAICEQQSGSEHPDTATRLDNLALLYQAQRKYVEAEPLLVRALAIRKQQLGADHLDTADSLTHLALIYLTQGKWAEVKLLYQRALTIFEQQLGPEHVNTQIVRENYTSLLQTMGYDEEAEGREI
jgi:tetratricopeptide (TPR) repeat protein